ncbi:MAG: PQ-loop domain-containing transporter [Candidatus Izemoplasma sp.]
MSVFEILMLVCFGFAWPTSIYKSLKSKSTNGKSLVFMIIIMIGYVFGILNKIYNNYDFVIYLYILNLLMVATDVFLYYLNSKNSSKDMV